MKRLLTFICLLCCLAASSRNVPEPKREFRGSWIQCVNGQFEGLSPQAMREKLTQQLDALERCHVNAVMFQVRAEADALYPSKLEPWSRFLTGTQGQAPQPYWDPLAWMIEQCHKRGMELHAWINPYRAKTAGTKDLAETHPYMQHPERFMKYGDLILFNPGLKENRKAICDVVRDIVTRYDVDGVHIDDYFYPYPQAGLEIPDQDTYRANNRGFNDIASWRRDNVDLLMQELYTTIHTIKPWVKFGVAPFGIYHNAKAGSVVPGSNTKGLQDYDDLYADVLNWINKGWVDYCIPQLYWPIGHPTADYETLTRWWAKNACARPLMIGQDVDRTVKSTDLKDQTINQLPAKIELQRTLPGIVGSCLWYSAAIAENHGNYATALSQIYQKNVALQPLMPFIDHKAPGKVKGLKAIWTPDGLILVWLAPKAKTVMDEAHQYVVYRFGRNEKKNLGDASHIVTITDKTFLKLPYVKGTEKYKYYVTVLDRLQNESRARSESVKL